MVTPDELDAIRARATEYDKVCQRCASLFAGGVNDFTAFVHAAQRQQEQAIGLAADAEDLLAHIAALEAERDALKARMEAARKHIAERGAHDSPLVELASYRHGLRDAAEFLRGALDGQP